jgi:hypothetical protein
MRKQFTPSERTAITDAIMADMPERRGRPEKSPAIAGNKPKGESVDIAAKQAGFKSAESYERAKTVVERGVPELVAAMDKGEIKIDAAAKIATQPKADQKRIVSMPKDQQREVGPLLVQAVALQTGAMT